MPGNENLAIGVNKCSYEHMSFIFQIRPVSLEKGFDLSCEGLLRDEVREPRLIDAIVHAVRLGRELDGEIQIFDVEGHVAEVLPLPLRGKHFLQMCDA
jgi:hypothetical protein